MIASVSHAPIFIGGLYRSGTSLMRAMLGQHSRIAGGLETFWFDLQWEEKRGERLGRRWDGTRDESLDMHLERLARFYELDEAAMARLIAQSADAETFIDLFLQEYAQHCGKSRWVEKTPANLLHLQHIFNVWPEARFIHVYRDPRDVYASLFRTGKWGTPSEFARLWIHFMSGYETGRLAVGPTSALLEVRYETLVLDPVGTMRTVITFVEEPWEESVARFEGDARDHQTVLRLTGKSSTTLKQLSNPLTTSRIGLWARDVAPQAVVEIETKVREAGFGALWERFIFKDAAP